MTKELEALFGRLDRFFESRKIYELNNPCVLECIECLNSIKQSLIKAQEQEKVLEIIKEKRVDLPYLRCCFEDNQNVYRYNEYVRNKTMDYDHEEELTQEEFDLLKRYLCQNE